MDTSPHSRHERPLQTRALLIRTTLQLVLERGYDSILVQDITDRADLGRGTFYLHFKDKEEVVWAAFRDLLEEFEQDTHSQLDRCIPQVEYFGFLNIFRHAEMNRDLSRVMFGGRGSAVLTGRVLDFLAGAFLHDIRHAPVPPEIDFKIPEEIEAQILTGIISQLLFRWLETPNNYSPEQMAVMTCEALYRKRPPEGPLPSRAGEQAESREMARGSHRRHS
jgi:AcrR family transcriptional regulator